MVKLLFAAAMLLALAACATAPPPSDEATASPMRASPSPTPAIVLPEPECASTRFTPPPQLTCEMAVAAALERVVLTTSPEAIWFEYGWYCPPGRGCPASPSHIGIVVVEQGSGQGDVFVEVTLEDSGRELIAMAGPVREYPPDPDSNPDP